MLRHRFLLVEEGGPRAVLLHGRKHSAAKSKWPVDQWISALIDIEGFLSLCF